MGDLGPGFLATISSSSAMKSFDSRYHHLIFHPLYQLLASRDTRIHKGRTVGLGNSAMAGLASAMYKPPNLYWG